MIPQVTWEQAKGKTIRDMESDFDGLLLITFTDNTFTVVQARNGYDGCSPDFNETTIRYGDITIADAVRLGIYTQEEYDAHLAAKIAERREAEIKARRATYEKLKKEFES